MTRADILNAQLEVIIYHEHLKGRAYFPDQMTKLVAAATDDQRRRAWERAQTHEPKLLPYKIGNGWDEGTRL